MNRHAAIKQAMKKAVGLKFELPPKPDASKQIAATFKKGK